MTSPIQIPTALNRLGGMTEQADSPLVPGAEAWLGDPRGYLKGLATPEGAQVLDSLIQLARLQAMVKILELLQGPSASGAPEAGAPSGAGGRPPRGEGRRPDHGQGGPQPPVAGAPKLENVGGREAIKVDGPGNFLWKPVSESDGKAVALLPRELAGAQVSVKAPNGATIAEPSRTDTFSDGRGIFRFGKPGASFPPGAYVEARLPDGTTRRFALADPSQRND
jgi:hypothetical protein